MPTDKYVIGVDFGTESGRVVVVRVRDGEEMAAVVVPYPDGVLDETLPGGGQLEPDTALQNPRDYFLVLKSGVRKALKQAGVMANDVIALGTDFTSCTVFSTTQDGTPLCLLPKYRLEPLAWAILWKHHAAQPEADRLNEIGRERDEEFIRMYGGKYSSEWFFAKVLQILNDSPEVYEAASRLIEGTDWIVWQLTGQEKRNNSTAGYKAMWMKGKGFPERDFFRAVHPRLENVIQEKVGTEFYPLGTPAGGLAARWARAMGLREGTPVSIGVADGHASIPATTVTKPGSLSMVMGTSFVQMLMGRERRIVEGICGVVEDGIVPGYWGYEAGQYAGGDMFAWFFDHAVPAYARSQAKKLKLPFTAWLEKQAAALRPGESGLLALDWWNGNRCVLVDADLSGLLIGAALSTPPEAIFRALMEAAAFGTRQIIEAFDAKGLHTQDVVACGGLPAKNRLLMQIYADVLGREIKVAKHPQTCSALGAAIHAAAAAGRPAGGYDSIPEAAAHMAHLQSEIYRPRPESQKIYNRLFQEFRILHDYFGRGVNDVMKRLKALRREIVAG